MNLDFLLHLDALNYFCALLSLVRVVLVDEVEQYADKELHDVNENNENALSVLHTPERSLLRHVVTEKSQDWLIIDADHYEALQNCRTEGSNRDENAQRLFKDY